MVWNKNQYGKDEHDIEISAERYIDQALTKAVDALGGDDLKNSLTQYIQFVDVAEKIANASRKLGEDYQAELSEARKEIYEHEQDNLKRLKKVADKKFELIVSSVLDTKPLFDELEL